MTLKSDCPHRMFNLSSIGATVLRVVLFFFLVVLLLRIFNNNTLYGIIEIIITIYIII